MRVVSTATLAIVATLAVSASAASLDVEPVELATPTTAPVDSHVGFASSPNATNNSTSGRKIGIHARRCDGMDYANWDDYKYACSWKHKGKVSVGEYYNQFFMRFDGSIFQQCGCDLNLDQYSPWGARWTYSNVYGVFCFAHDGRKDESVQEAFAHVSCSRL